MATPSASTIQAPRTSHALERYVQARAAAMASFVATNRIQPLWRALTQATDALLAGAAGDSGITLVAVGGYGRRELFPYSDIDVLVLLPAGTVDALERGVIALLQSLWDQQIPVSHATRSVEETIQLAREDATIAAALMDARYLAGDRKPYLALKRRLRLEVFGQQPRQFVEAKLAERETRHAKYGDSRFMLEPNVKEGKGGLRDLQTLSWLTRYCYGTAKAQDVIRDDMLSAREWRTFRQAYLFFATLRAHLHIQRGRADERLSFDLQPSLATALKFRGRTPQLRAERLMLRYFQFTRAVGNMTRVLCATLEEQQLRAQPAPFVQEHVARELPAYLHVVHGRLHFTDAADLEHTPAHLLGLFAAAQQYGLDIHPRAQLMISRILPRMGRALPLDGESNRALLGILLSPNAPEVTLRRMNEMGVLAAIVPEFGKLTGQMQYDGYHTYTVDEHILMAIGNLRQLEQGVWEKPFPIASALAAEARDRAVLYTAMLCHDIAKGTGGMHADKGAELAQHVAWRLGLQAEEAALVGWLVRHHALLSDVAFKRDLDDPKTIADFVAVVQSPERLRLLLLITVADIKAVGPSIFNGWKAALMRALYQRAVAAMGVGGPYPQDMLHDEALVAQWMAQPQSIAMHLSHDTFEAVTLLTLCAASSPRLFTVIAGALAGLGANIVSARLRPLPEDAGMAATLVQLRIQNLHGESFVDDARRLAALPQRIAEGLRAPDTLGEGIAERRVVARVQAVPVRSGVFIDNQASSTASVVEVNARDRVGLLHDMLRAFDACQLTVLTAHIATYGQLAVDVFYVKDAYGHKLTHGAKQAQLQQLLTHAIEPTKEPS